jgi:hypothetical protein
MPSVTLVLVEGRGEEEIASPLEASHRAPVAVFGIPMRDRYQVEQNIGAGFFLTQQWPWETANRSGNTRLNHDEATQ